MFNDREHATILAALRYWQGVDSSFDTITPELRDVLTNGETVDPLTTDEIDTLCERFNSDEFVDPMNPTTMPDGTGPGAVTQAPAAPPSPLPRLAIVMEGGIVQSVCSDRPDLVRVESIVVIDYDDDGAEDGSLAMVRQGDGSYSDAYVSGIGIDKAEIDLAQVNAEDSARDAALEAGWSRDNATETFERATKGKSKPKTSDAETWAELCKEHGIDFLE